MIPFAQLAARARSGRGVHRHGEQPRRLAGRPVAFGLTWAEPYRAARIREAIEAKPRLTPADVAALQLDRVSVQARDLLPLLLDTGRSTRRRETRSSGCAAGTARWRRSPCPRRSTRPGSSSSRRCRRTSSATFPAGRTRGRFLIHALTPRLGVVRRRADAAGRDVRRLQGGGLRDAVAGSRARSARIPSAGAGNACTTRVFPHDVFDEVPVLRRLFDLEVGQGGDGSTVNVGGFSQDGSFEMTDGPSYRQVIDLSNLADEPLRPHDRPVGQRLLPAATAICCPSGGRAAPSRSGTARPSDARSRAAEDAVQDAARRTLRPAPARGGARIRPSAALAEQHAQARRGGARDRVEVVAALEREDDAAVREREQPRRHAARIRRARCASSPADRRRRRRSPPRPGRGRARTSRATGSRTRSNAARYSASPHPARKRDVDGEAFARRRRRPPRCAPVPG